LVALKNLKAKGVPMKFFAYLSLVILVAGLPAFAAVELPTDHGEG
jgi:hypothetical protein